MRPFNDRELEEFLFFINQNRLNFPGSYFIVESNIENLEINVNSASAKTDLPLYLTLSKKSIFNLEGRHYNAFPVVLTDESYSNTTHYTLNFDIIGKIEIYKEAKRKFL